MWSTITGGVPEVTSAADIHARLGELLSGTRVLLLDFDGPVCHLFAGHPAHEAADAVRAYAVERGDELSEPEGGDPLVLLRVAYQHSQEFGRDVEAFVIGQETQAARSAAPTEGAHDTITAATAAGLDVLIVSNNSERAIRTYLARHGLTENVAHIIGRPFGQPARMKPAPDLLTEALDISRIKPSDAVFVGDSITDVLAGNAVAVPTIGYAKRRAQGLADADAALVTDSMTTIAAALRHR